MVEPDPDDRSGGATSRSTGEATWERAPGHAEGAEPGGHAVDETSRRLGYEIEDASGGALAKVMAVGVAIIAASVAILFYVVGVMHRDQDVGPPLTAEQRAEITPPGPPLQAHPFRDIDALRKSEEDRLNGFGYLDGDHKRARIPLARAETLVLGKPLDPPP